VAVTLEDESGAWAAENEFWDRVPDAPGDEAAGDAASNRFILATWLSQSTRKPPPIKTAIPSDPTITAHWDPEDFTTRCRRDRRGGGDDAA